MMKHQSIHGKRHVQSLRCALFVILLGNMHFGEAFVRTASNLVQTQSSDRKLGLRQPLHLQGQRDQNDNSDQEEDPVDAFRAEQEAAQKVARRLMMPRIIVASISQTITALCWTFLIVTFVLQALGYALVVEDVTGLRIDTLDAQKFQQEVAKSMKELSQ
jgi:hypothetical protein